MIQRVVAVALKPEFRTAETLRTIATETRRVLRDAHGVLSVEVATAADGRTRSEWDFCILVRFAGIDDVERYRTDPIHRAYADVFLAPMRRAIRVWNFSLEPGDDD